MSLANFYKPLPHIALFAKRRAGKDEVYKLLDKMGFDVKRVAYGDPLRSELYRLLPDLPRDPKPVKELIIFGQAMREIDTDIWVKHTMRAVEQETDSLLRAGLRPHTYVFTDVRQWNEYQACKALGCIAVKVEASEKVRTARMIELGETVSRETLYAPTETTLDGFPYDFSIENNGTPQELKQNVIELIYQIQKQRGLK